jgi:hypothetical protein
MLRITSMPSIHHPHHKGRLHYWQYTKYDI